jgi:predicted transcriptional regulator
MEELDRVAADIDDHDAWFRQKVTGGLEQLDRGEFLTHEEVGARLKKMSQP